VILEFRSIQPCNPCPRNRIKSTITKIVLLFPRANKQNALNGCMHIPLLPSAHSYFILAVALPLDLALSLSLSSIVDYGVGENRSVHLKKIAAMGSQQVRGRITITLAPDYRFCSLDSPSSRAQCARPFMASNDGPRTLCDLAMLISRTENCLSI
jgi:hypothetical protein